MNLMRAVAVLLFLSLALSAKTEESQGVFVSSSDVHVCNAGTCEVPIRVFNLNRSFSGVVMAWDFTFDSPVSNVELVGLDGLPLGGSGKFKFDGQADFAFGTAKQFVLKFTPKSRAGSWNASLQLADISVFLDPTYVSACSTLDQANTSYELSQSLSIQGLGCIEVSAQNVSFDCAGFSISGNQAAGTSGVYSTGADSNVLNCTVNGFYSGVYLENASGGFIYNTTSTNNSFAGVNLLNSSYAEISYSKASSNLHGIIFNSTNSSNASYTNFSYNSGNSVFFIDGNGSTIFNSTVSFGSGLDVQSSGYSNNSLLNTTFAKSSVGNELANSYLNVKWYARFRVLNSSNSALSGAQVNWSSALAPSSVSTLSTGSDGLTSYAELTEYMKYSGGLDNSTPYSVNASIDNHYYSGVTSCVLDSLYLVETATKELSVNGSWATIYGSVGTVLAVASSSGVYSNWSNAQAEGVIYAVAGGDVVNFHNLVALSRNTTGYLSATDFDDLSDALGILNRTDSIAKVFGASGTPDQTQTFTLRGYSVENIPTVNSSNSSNFLTGIIWESTDGSPSYNQTAKSPVAFVTLVNRSAQGLYGVYDFEVRVPTSLSTYAGGSEVDLYLELE